MTIALIAGTGGLPPHLAGSLMIQGRVPVICEMRGFPSDIKGEFTRIPFRIETLGSLLTTLTSLGVREVCLAGAVSRPNVDPSTIDAATAPLMPRLLAAMTKGDDGTLREVIAIFEDAGFDVIGAHQIAPDLLPIAGVYTNVAPPDLGDSLIAAHAALDKMGQADRGQAMLLRDGAVIAREDSRGTAAMLQDHCAPPNRGGGGSGDPLFGVVDLVGDMVSGAADWLSGADGVGLPGQDAFLFKAPKPDQNLFADMPLIGPDTTMQAAEAGLAGIVILANTVMVLDLPQVIAILNAQNMFLWVHP
ncbi:UDP-2,3-diacylglucosamine diphosphatase LpxI [Octadecabacter sp.]|nr:UDP-2,3-diacylglucosamine diphosphatase LpxI [Octadecabacter sp.]